MKAVIGAIGLAFSLSACATVTKGVNEDVMFTSNPSDLKVQISNGMSCMTPCSLKISRKEKFVATFKKGSNTRTINVDTQVRGSGGAALAGNVLVGGVIGIGVDAATGSSLDHIPNPVHADFDKPQSAQIDAAKYRKLQSEQSNEKPSTSGVSPANE